MDHNEALQSNASDRYALNMLSAAETDAFEEHYFDCATCAEDVRLGISLMDGGRRLVRENEAAPPAPAPNVVPIDSHPRRKYLSWIPAAAAAALLVVNGGLLMRTPAPVVIAESAHFSSAEIRGDKETPREETLVLADGQTGQLEMDFPPDYQRVEARVVRGGKVISTHEIEKRELIQITLPDPEPGSYELVIDGEDPQGQHAVTRFGFIVKRPTSTR